MLAKVTVAEAANAVADAPDRIRLEFIAPFVEAAARVLTQECGESVSKGQLFRVRSPQTSNEVSALIAITGGLSGLVIYTMSEATACGFASRMMGETVEEFDAMAQSAVAELANMITGQASIGLEKNGYSTDMSPPVLFRTVTLASATESMKGRSFSTMATTCWTTRKKPIPTEIATAVLRVAMPRPKPTSE